MDELWTICGQSLPVQALSDQFEDVFAPETHPRGLELVILFLDQPVVPQFQKMAVDPVPPECVGTTAGVELSFPFRETSWRWDYSNLIPADSSTSNLIFLQNSLSSHKFLVDTGASVSVYPHHPRHPHTPSVGVQLRTAASTTMDTFGSRQIALQFGPPCFEWTFLLADLIFSAITICWLT